MCCALQKEEAGTCETSPLDRPGIIFPPAGCFLRRLITLRVSDTQSGAAAAIITSVVNTDPPKTCRKGFKHSPKCQGKDGGGAPIDRPVLAAGRSSEGAFESHHRTPVRHSGRGVGSRRPGHGREMGHRYESFIFSSASV